MSDIEHLFKFSPGDEIEIPEVGTWKKSVHVFDEKTIWAIRAALVSGRPLLLRGEPGIGKSQVARAAACALDVPFLSFVVDERTERDDLLFRMDAVSRLALAQVVKSAGELNLAELAEEKFVCPGALWWAVDWESAMSQQGIYEKTMGRALPKPEASLSWLENKPRGPVILIDEIDKADPSVPNGLLEALGNGGFQSSRLPVAVKPRSDSSSPLVVITTNEERDLPAAFMRRCLVLSMILPSSRAAAFEFLVKRARATIAPNVVSEKSLQEIFRMLWTDRKAAKELGGVPPGASEFLDLVGILADGCAGDDDKQIEVLARVSEFALQKSSVDGVFI